jgi:Zn-dependent protease with chaperone function
MQAFFIAPVGKQVANLFATHPPIEQRIARLERLESQLQGARLAPAA